MLHTIRAFMQPVVPETKLWSLSKTVPDARAHNIVLAAFATPSEDMLTCLSESMPDKGSLTIICPEPVKMPTGKFRKRFIKGHPSTAALLHDAGLDSADSVLLAGMHDWEDTEADIQVCNRSHLAWLQKSLLSSAGQSIVHVHLLLAFSDHIMPTQYIIYTYMLCACFLEGPCPWQQ